MRTKRAEYRLSPKAVRDLESIWSYTFGEWGIDQANRHINDLTAAFDRIAAGPQIASACDHIRIGYRRLSVGRHVIYFRAKNFGVEVIRVLHAKMDAERYF